MDIIEIQDRTFVALRLLGRRPPGTRPVFSAVSPNCRMALCSVEPGSSSGWAEPPAAEVTCQVCIQRVEKLAAHHVSRSWPQRKPKRVRNRGSGSTIATDAKGTHITRPAAP
jgi:hypothetical protein